MQHSERLTADEVARAQKTGLTFAPRTHGLVCNQIPRLGVITARQAETLRSQVWPRNVAAKAKRQRRPAVVMTVHLRSYCVTTCPYCHKPNFNVEVGEWACDACGVIFAVKAASDGCPSYYR